MFPIQTFKKYTPMGGSNHLLGISRDGVQRL